MSKAIPEPVLREKPDPKKAGDLERWCREVAAWFDRYPVEAVVQAGAEAADVRRFTVTVKDRRLRATVGPWRVHLWITDDLTGLVPGGTQVVTFITGTVLETYDPDVRWSVLTDTGGVIVLDVEVTGAGTRKIVPVVEPGLNASDSVAWA